MNYNDFLYSDGNNVTLQTTNNGLNIYRYNKIQVQNSGVYICTATQTAKEKTYIINKVCYYK